MLDSAMQVNNAATIYKAGVFVHIFNIHLN